MSAKITPTDNGKCPASNKSVKPNRLNPRLMWSLLSLLVVLTGVLVVFLLLGTNKTPSSSLTLESTTPSKNEDSLCAQNSCEDNNTLKKTLNACNCSTSVLRVNGKLEDEDAFSGDLIGLFELAITVKQQNSGELSVTKQFVKKANKGFDIDLVEWSKEHHENFKYNCDGNNITSQTFILTAKFRAKTQDRKIKIQSSASDTSTTTEAEISGAQSEFLVMVKVIPGCKGPTFKFLNKPKATMAVSATNPDGGNFEGIDEGKTGDPIEMRFNDIEYEEDYTDWQPKVSP